MKRLLPLNRPALLIRNDVWEDYRPEITTGSDLEAFLRTLRDADPAQVPCAASPFASEQLYWYAPSEPLAVFLPERGYYPLVRAGGTAALYGLWASVNGGKVQAQQEMDAAQEAVERYLGLVEEKLIDLYTTKKHGDLTAYPAILCNTEDFFSVNHKVYHPAFRELDFSGYHIAILYSGVQPRVPGEETAVSQPCAAAPAKANAAEFDRFLTWLKNAASHHRLRRHAAQGGPAGGITARRVMRGTFCTRSAADSDNSDGENDISADTPCTNPARMI